MSMDPSLKAASSLSRHRNVLKRGERLLRLAGEDRWTEDKAVLGLPKVGNRKASVGKAEPKAAADATAAAPAAGAKGAAAPAAKGAAPAAKAGAPAAKAAAAPAAKKK